MTPSTHTEALPPIGKLPTLPGDWRWHGRSLVYEGPHYEEWAKFLSAMVDIGRASGEH